MLAAEPKAKPPHEVFYFYRGLTLEGVRSGPWKLRLAKGELFDLAADVGETSNVAELHAHVVRKWRDRRRHERRPRPGWHRSWLPTAGCVANPVPLLDQAGKIRAGFEVK